MNEGSSALWSELFGRFEPPERLTRSEWAERHRRLSPEASSKAGGLFSFDCFPWQVEPLNMVDSPDHGRMVLMWASQVTGKTETMNNIVGSQIDIDPCPVLVLQPTGDMAEAWSKDRLATMIRDTPRLRRLIRDPRSRDSGNTILHKTFPGGHIAVVGTNAPSKLASRPIRIVLADEVDRFPESSGTEGDPLELAVTRTKSFKDAFVVTTSTPTIKGRSRVETEFNLSDQRRWYCPCPKCGEHQVLAWRMVKWEDDNPRTAWMECQLCGERLDDEDRQDMVRAGEWRADNPGSATLGYHINGMNVLLAPQKPWRTRLEEMVADYLHHKAGGIELVKKWTNTFLAETWDQPAEKHDPVELLKRREAYPAEVPEGGLIIVKSVDVQGDRLEIYTEAIGIGDECWAVDYRVIMGNPTRAAVWRELEADLETTYRHETGHQLTASIVAIDQGDKTEDVRRFVRAHQPLCIAVKGDPKAGALVFRFQKTPVQGIRPYMLGTDTIKDRLFLQLKTKEMGPGYHHFPVDDRFGPEYFAQLTAEKAVIEHNKRGLPVRVYKKDKHARNEALDLKVYAAAAWAIYKYQRRPDLEYIAQQLRESDPVDTESAGVTYHLRKRRSYQRRETPAAEPAKVTQTPVATRRRGGKGSNWVNNW